MEEILNYVKPELLILIPVLYFIGDFIKRSEIKNRFIPLVLMLIGVILCGCFVIATSEIVDVQTLAMAIFTAIAQGIIVAGMSTYVDQLLKLNEKKGS